MFLFYNKAFKLLGLFCGLFVRPFVEVFKIYYYWSLGGWVWLFKKIYFTYLLLISLKEE